jgi:hypothetical protein
MAAPKKPKLATKNSVKAQKDQATAGLESAFAKTTVGLEENDRLYEQAQKKLKGQLAIQELINNGLKEAKGLTEEQVTATGKLSKMWGDFQSLAAQYHQDVKDGVMTQEQANKKLKEMRVGFDRMLKSSQLNTKETEDLLQVFKDMGSEMKSVEKAYDKTAKKAGLLNAAIDHVGSSGVPLMQEFGGVLKNVVEKNAEGARLAMTALGAAAGALSMKYFGAETEAGTKALNDAKQNLIDGQREVLKLANKRGFITQRADLETKQNNINTYGELNKLEQKKGFIGKQIGLEVNQNSIDTANEVNRLTIEAAHSSQRAAIQFSAQLQTGAAEFKAAAKTALYGKGIGSIGYGAAQMQLAGVGAENVAASLTTATKALGTKVTSDVAADMAVLEKRTGQSSENISGMMSFFKRMGKLTNESALNMTEGMRAMADSAGIDLGGYMEEVAQASKEALGYQIKSGPALQKQVAYAQQLGVSFGDIAKAGKSMVLNYKDSIKKEMELSAMLGKNVNLSEARALFAQGKTDDALKSIKAQGLDPTKMNMFQQEALSQALGGMDLDSIQKIATGSAKDVSAQTGNVKGGNKEFLKTTQSAQSTLASQTASIQAQTAIVDAKLSGQITKAYLESDGYKQYQKNLLQQQKDQALLENEITNSYLKSPAYQKYQSFLLGQQMAESKLNTLEENTFITSSGAIKNAADAAKLGIERMFDENWRTGLAAIAGGIGGNIVGKGIEKLMGGVQKVFVVNQDGDSSVTDMLDSDGPDSKNKKPRKTRGPKGPRGPRPGGSKMSKIFNSAKSLLPKITNSLKPANLLKGGAKLLKGGLPGIIGGLALNAFGEDQAAKGNKKTAAGADIASSALSGAGYGAMIGSIIPGVGNVVGGAVGGVLGGAYGLYQNWGTMTAPSAPAAKAPSTAKTPAKAGTTTVVGAPGAQGGGVSVPAGMLSAAEYQVKLQIKMVQLMGVSAALLEAILLETDSKPVLSVNGIKLNQQLMASSLKTMAVNRRDGGTPRM